MQIRERISVEHSGTLLVLLFCPRTPPRKRAIEESEKIGLCRKAPPHNPLRPFGRVLGPRLSRGGRRFWRSKQEEGGSSWLHFVSYHRCCPLRPCNPSHAYDACMLPFPLPFSLESSLRPIPPSPFVRLRRRRGKGQ